MKASLLAYLIGAVILISFLTAVDQAVPLKDSAIIVAVILYTGAGLLRAQLQFFRIFLAYLTATGKLDKTAEIFRKD